MVSAVVLMNIKRGKVQAVGNFLADLSGITEVFSVGGRYDLVALVRVNNNDELAELVSGKVAEIEEVTKTETLIAFQVFSEHDLEAMFSIGG